MPISLRLPTDIEAQIASFSARQGMSKSAVIVRSIQEFLAKNTQPSSFDIYENAMRASAVDNAKTLRSDTQRALAEQRPVKLQMHEALRRKHAQRSARASQALSSIGSIPESTA